MSVPAGRKEGQERSALNLSYVSFTLSPPSRHTQRTPLWLLLPLGPSQRIVREDYFRKVPEIGRDHVEIRVLCDATTIPCADFSRARVRKSPLGILRYCHRIFSRNPLRSYLGPWTHALLSSPFSFQGRWTEHHPRPFTKNRRFGFIFRRDKTFLIDKFMMEIIFEIIDISLSMVLLSFVISYLSRLYIVWLLERVQTGWLFNFSGWYLSACAHRISNFNCGCL